MPKCDFNKVALQFINTQFIKTITPVYKKNYRKKTIGLSVWPNEIHLFSRFRTCK